MPVPDFSADEHQTVTRRLVLAATLWAAAVILAAGSGALARLWQPLLAGLILLGIGAPIAWYFLSPFGRPWASRVGLRAITAFHIWRIPAALLFFWYGAQDALPPLFWIAAGVGDLIAGLWALAVVRRPLAGRNAFLLMHGVGFADFLLAVGNGLAHTLLADPRIGAVAALPLALVPFFGVGISGASHVVAFDMLRTRVRTPAGIPNAGNRRELQIRDASWTLLTHPRHARRPAPGPCQRSRGASSAAPVRIVRQPRATRSG